MPDASTCQTTAETVAYGGVGAIVFGGLLALWILVLERSGGMEGWRAAERWRRRGVRRWNWGWAGLFLVGGVIALVVAMIMRLVDTNFGC